MKYNRLVAFGCSLTYGHGLEDCCSGKRKTGPGKEPSKYAWPNVLANIMGIDCCNLSKPGASNKRIAYTVYSSDLTDKDLVFVNWSYASRYCVITKSKIIDLSIEPQGAWKGKINNAFRHLADANDLMLDSILRVDYTKLLLDKNKITNFHTLSNKKDFNSYTNKNMLTTSMGPIRDMFPLAIDKSHPGREAHAYFAEEIYREIQNKL